MHHRRILSLWFPRLGAERVLRVDRGLTEAPLAVAANIGNAQVLVSLSVTASEAGLTPGQPLRDAQAMCPELITRLQNPLAEAAFLQNLRRWAGKFSPWVAEEPPEGLMVDLTGCAHLFGGEAGLLTEVEADCAGLGLTVRAGIADTPGAAWALARYAGRASGGAARSGDDIDQEARATRSRAARRRHWEKGGPAPQTAPLAASAARIAPIGGTRAAIGPLPVAALRLEDQAVTDLVRLGLRRVEDLAGQPRAALARRFGAMLVRRLDQAMGTEPEPITPAKPPDHFAVRLTLPEPVGLEDDMLAALDRLLPRLTQALEDKGRGAREVRLEAQRVDQGTAVIEVGLARPSANPDRIRPLLAMKIGDIDAGFGIDRIRLVATRTEPVHAHQHRGHLDAARDGADRVTGGAPLDDLIGKLGARLGLEAITRLHPADSHIPEKTALTLGAAWSEPAQGWPDPPGPRPVLLWRPEMVTAPDVPALPMQFRWRRRDLSVVAAVGPERIAPEWWLDEPDWRTGLRDYWRVTTDAGEVLWLYFAHGAAMSAGWFCQGRFA
ncbi:MAG: DUF6504 family protein [Pseudomonadota bacterium]